MSVCKIWKTANIGLSNERTASQFLAKLAADQVVKVQMDAKKASTHLLPGSMHQIVNYEDLQKWSQHIGILLLKMPIYLYTLLMFSGICIKLSTNYWKHSITQIANKFFFSASWMANIYIISNQILFYIHIFISALCFIY